MLITLVLDISFREPSLRTLPRRKMATARCGRFRKNSGNAEVFSGNSGSPGVGIEGLLC